MNIKTKWKYAQMSILSGGVAFVNKKELLPESMLTGVNVYIYAVNSDKGTLHIQNALIAEGANLVRNRNEAKVFVNFFNTSININDTDTFVESDVIFSKRLFFVCQEEKDLLLSRACGGKIINILDFKDNISNNSKAIISSGIESLTRGLAIATAQNKITVNALIINGLIESLDDVAKTVTFLVSDLSNDVLGQVIKFEKE